MRAKTVYLLLAVLGALVPYMRYFPWLQEHGLDLSLFLRQLHANQVSEFFAADVIVSAGVVLIFLFFERRRLGSLWWMPVIALVIFGVRPPFHFCCACENGREQREALLNGLERDLFQIRLPSWLERQFVETRRQVSDLHRLAIWTVRRRVHIDSILSI